MGVTQVDHDGKFRPIEYGCANALEFVKFRRTRIRKVAENPEFAANSLDSKVSELSGHREFQIGFTVLTRQN